MKMKKNHRPTPRFLLILIFFSLVQHSVIAQITINTNTTTASVNTSGDPVIVSGSGYLKYSDINIWLGDGISVLVQSSGDITISESITKSSGGNAYLTLKANGSIWTTDNKTITSSSGALSVVFWADADGGGNGSGTVEVQCDMTTNGGGVWMGGGGSSASWTPYTGATALTVGNGPAPGTTNNGVSFYGAATINTGAGNIKIYGEMYGHNNGFYSGDNTQIITTDGDVEITGANNNNGNSGVWTRTAITTGSGNISLSGSGDSDTWGGLNSDWGLMLYSSSGTITLDGTNANASGPSIRFGGGGKVGYDGSILTSSTSNVIFRGDSFLFGTTSLNTSGTFTIEPKSASFPAAFSMPANLSWVSTLSGLTIGKSGNTSDITLSSALSVSGPLSLYGTTATASSTTTCTDLTVNTGTTLAISSGASLITTGTITNNGTISLSRTISSDIWHLISVPVTSATAASFEGDYLQNWTESTHAWTDITSTSTALTPARGYGLWTPSKDRSNTYTISGTPLTGNQSIAITDQGTGGSYNGANLVGNPYPSSIDWNTLWETYGTVYYWDSQNGQYDTWNGSTGTNGGQQYLPPWQGFFIIADGDGTFSLTDGNRTHENTSSFYKGASTLPSNSIGLVTTNNEGHKDEYILVFDDLSSPDFEFGFDAWKLNNGVAGAPEISSMTAAGNLAIDKRPATDQVQLIFMCDAAGIYSIGISQIADITIATLEDTQESIFHDLTKEPYSFSWDPSDDDDRFILHLGPNGVGNTTQPDNDLLIYTHDGALHLKSLSGTPYGTLSITDMAGRTLYQNELTIDGETLLNPEIPAGAYAIRFTSEKNVITKKVIIN